MFATPNGALQSRAKGIGPGSSTSAEDLMRIDVSTCDANGYVMWRLLSLCGQATSSSVQSFEVASRRGARFCQKW